MMNGADWREMTWQEYTTRLWHWNERHGDLDQPAIDLDRARKAFDNASIH